MSPPARLLGVGAPPEDDDHPPDGLHRFRSEPLAQAAREFRALHAVERREPDLDELVVIERTVGLGQHRLAQPRVADEDDGFQGMRPGAQPLAFDAGERHRGGSR